MVNLMVYSVGLNEINLISFNQRFITEIVYPFIKNKLHSKDIYY
jgi:hypothetical protein